MRGGGGRRPRGGSARYATPKPPATKVKDHRSDGGHNPFFQRPRRSVSPPAQSRPRQSPGPRSSSIERRDFASRRADHGKHPLHENHHSGNRPTPFEDVGYEFQHKHTFSDYLTNPIPEVNPGSKLPRAVKDVDFHSQSSGDPALASSGLNGQSMLLRKSIFTDDGPARTFFTLPPGNDYLSGAAALNSAESRGNSIGNLKAGIRHHEMLHYNDHPRDSYDGTDKDKVYPRDVTIPMISSSQTRPFSGTASSSGLAKDDSLGMYRDHLHHPSDGFSRGVVSNFLEDPLERRGYGQVQLSDPMRRRPLSPPARDGPRDYGYHELGRNERGDRGFPTTNSEYKEMSWDHRGDFKDTLSSSFMDLAGDRVYGTDVSKKNLSDSSFWDQHRSLRGSAALDYRDVNMVREDYIGGSGSERVGFRMKPSRDHGLAPYEEERDASGRDTVPMVYRERPRSPLLSDYDVDMYRQGVSPPRGTSHMDEFGIYDMPSERMNRRKYVMDGDETETDSRSLFSNGPNVFRRIHSGGDERWSEEDRVVYLPSKKLAFGHPQHRMSARRVSDAWLQSADSSAHAEGGRNMSFKRRLRPEASEFQGSFYSEKKHDYFRPHKFWKRGLEDRQGGLNAHDGDTLDDDMRIARTDPPKDSEEFKLQVHKAFLRFSKLLNESLHHQRRYRDQGKAGNLLCGVCGSNSKEFVDTHSLVTHTYNSLKVGLRTEHLGLHKALCVLMGWNWLMAPDNSRVYQSRPVAEAKALKEDLILWPPLVIIHNSSIGNKNNADGAKVVTIEGMEEILRDMGFGKNRVGRGRPANQSVFLVKFLPTFSGLREAERLHERYANHKRGRLEFQQITSGRSGGGDGDDKVGGAPAEKMEEILYGYMAVADDLDKLDPETKKRSLVKSKKDIEAIADAPLNAD